MKKQTSPTLDDSLKYNEHVVNKHLHKWILPWTAWTNTHGQRELTLKDGVNWHSHERREKSQRTSFHNPHFRPEVGHLNGVASAAPLAWIIVCDDQHLHEWILPWTAWTDTLMNGMSRVNSFLSTIHNSTAFPAFCLWKWLSIDMNAYNQEKSIQWIPPIETARWRHAVVYYPWGIFIPEVYLYTKVLNNIGCGV
jgi:hypothetical protein